MPAVVTGVEPFGLFVQGLDLPAEGLVAIDSLPEDAYRFERANHTLVGRRPGNAFRLGDQVRVTVHRVDLDRRSLDFRLVVAGGRGRGGAARAPGRTGRPAGTKAAGPHAGGGKRGPNGRGKAKKRRR